MIGGLALSGLMSPAVAAVLLIAYFLTAIHVYLDDVHRGHASRSRTALWAAPSCGSF